MNEHLIEQITREEGCVLHCYRDHLGFETIGIGRMVDKRKGGGITKDEAHFLLNHDIARIDQELRSRFPWFASLDQPRQGALINMAFQLGLGGLSGFPKMLACMRDGRYDEAETHALDSTWAREQTPARARRVARQLASGAWEA